MSYSEHKNRAEFHLERSRQKREAQGWSQAGAHAAAAQVEATLALAEQQRLANVIEYMKGATSVPEAMTPEAVDWAAERMESVRDGIGL